MKDVLPPESSKWQYAEERARALLETFTYRELRASQPLAEVYVAHARWKTEPVTRWYRLTRDQATPRIDAATFGAPGANVDAEGIALAVALFEEIGVARDSLSLSVEAPDDVRAALRPLGMEPTSVGHAAAVAGDAPSTFRLRAGDLVVADGGREDGLVASLGGPATPAFLLNINLAATISVLSEPAASFEPPVVAFFACDGPRARTWALAEAHRLRLGGIRTEIDHRPAAVDEQLRRATVERARLVIVANDKALERGEVAIRDLAAGTTETIALEEVDSNIVRYVD